MIRKVEEVEPLIEAQLQAPVEEGVPAKTLQQLEDSTLVGKAPSFFSQTRLLVVWPLGCAAVYLGLLWMLRII